MDAMNSPETMAYLQKHIMNPPGVTLSTLLGADDKALVERAANAVGAPFGMMEGFRPWFASLQLTVLFAVHEGFDPNSGVDVIAHFRGGRGIGPCSAVFLHRCRHCPSHRTQVW